MVPPSATSAPKLVPINASKRPAENSIDMASAEQIFEALKSLQTTVSAVRTDVDTVKTGVSKIESALAVNEERWRGATKEGERIEKELHDVRSDVTTLSKQFTEHRISMAKVIGWAAGAGAISAAVISAVVGIITKLIR